MIQGLPDFVLVTGNEGKRREVERLLGGSVSSVKVDLPEIQSLDVIEILEGKADEAWKRLGRPLVVEETSLELEALDGFPGPLVKWMLQAVGAEGIARTGLALGNPAITARCVLLFTDGTRRVIAEGITEGNLVLPARGGEGFGWDPVFQPRGEQKTYGELSAEEKDLLGHRGRAWRALEEKMRDAFE